MIHGRDSDSERPNNLNRDKSIRKMIDRLAFEGVGNPTEEDSSSAPEEIIIQETAMIMDDDENATVTVLSPEMAAELLQRIEQNIQAKAPQTETTQPNQEENTMNTNTENTTTTIEQTTTTTETSSPAPAAEPSVTNIKIKIGEPSLLAKAGKFLWDHKFEIAAVAGAGYLAYRYFTKEAEVELSSSIYEVLPPLE